jgi:hypothetical protein
MEQVGFHNLKYLERHPDTPLLYDSGVRYELPEQLAKPISRRAMSAIASTLRREGVSRDKIESVCNLIDGVEVFRDTPRLYSVGAGDCDNLVMTRLAELWRAGIPARAGMTARVNDDGGTTYHAVVQLPPMPGIADESGVPQPTIEDPSRILGMGTEAERNEAIRQNVERVEVLCARASRICATIGGDVDDWWRWIELCGFVPRSGVFRC